MHLKIQLPLVINTGDSQFSAPPRGCHREAFSQRAHCGTIEKAPFINCAEHEKTWSFFTLCLSLLKKNEYAYCVWVLYN